MNANPSTIPDSSSAITLTDNAAIKISELIIEEDNSKLNLRVFITGGGCSGFQYGFIFDESINNDDICVLKKVKRERVDKDADEEDEGGEGIGSMQAKPSHKTSNNRDKDDKAGGRGRNSVDVKLIVDPMSFQYLVGAEIDYKSDVKGEQFIIRNPMAKTTCGCGSSFSI